MNEPEPTPVSNERTPVWELVIADMEERNRIGTEKYGTPLQAHNGRDALVDAYQEGLDLVVYLRQEIEERMDPEIVTKLITLALCVCVRRKLGVVEKQVINLDLYPNGKEENKK